MKNKFKSIKTKVLLPVALLFTIMIIVVYIVVANETKESIVNQSVTNAVSTVGQYKTLRGYYAKNIISKVKGKVKINFDHSVHEDTIPLPATMISDLGALQSAKKDGIKLSLYSDYPFPNRSTRTLDRFSKEAMASFRKTGSTEPIVEQMQMDGKEVIRVAVSDFMLSDKACVNCHNSRADTPKNDWKVGDVRGVLEVIVPIDNELKVASDMNLEISSIIIIFALAILGFLIFIFNKNVSKPLNEFSNSLGGFFKYLNRETTDVKSIDIASEDEIGSMARVVNDNIDKIKKGIEEDNRVINEVKNSVNLWDKCAEKD